MCEKRLKITRKYVNSLAENELRLMSELQSSSSAHYGGDPMNQVMFVDGGSESNLMPDVKLEENDNLNGDWNDSLKNEWTNTNEDGDETTDDDDENVEFVGSSSDDEQFEIEPRRKVKKKVNNVKKSSNEKPPSVKKTRKRNKKREPDDFDKEIEAMEATADGKVTCKYCQKQILKVYYRQVRVN